MLYRFGIARSSKEECEGEMATASREHKKTVRNLKARVSSYNIACMLFDFTTFYLRLN